MFTETHAQMNLLDRTMRQSNRNYGEVSENDLELSLQDRRHRKYNDIVVDKEIDWNFTRSGSAPPTTERSLSAISSILSTNPEFSTDSYCDGINSIGCNTATDMHPILSEEEIRSHPAYLSYYYSHENFNPRLPPPLLSREHWRMAQRLRQSFGGLADWTPMAEDERVAFDDDVNGSSSLFSVQPILSPSARETMPDNWSMGISNSNAKSDMSLVSSSTERLHRQSDGMFRLSRGDAGRDMRRRKSFADILQAGLDRSASKPSRLSRPASNSCLNDATDKTDTIYSPHTYYLHDDMGLPRVQSFRSLVSHSDLSALPGCKTPDPHAIERTQSPRIPTAMKRVTSVEDIKNSYSINTLNRAFSSSMNNLADIAASISILSQSINKAKHEDCHVPHNQKVRFDDDPIKALKSFAIPKVYDNVKAKSEPMAKQNDSVFGFDVAQRTSSPHHCLKTPPGFTNLEKPNFSRRNDSSPVKMPSRCAIGNKLEFSSYLDEGGSTLADGRNGQNLRMQKVSDPGYIHPIASPMNSSQGSDVMLRRPQEANPLLAHPKNHYNSAVQNSNGFSHHPHYLNPDFGSSIPCKANTAAMAESVNASGGYGNTVMPKGRNSCFNAIPLGANIGDAFTSPSFEERKSNKTRPLKLVDVVDSVFDFSKDQFGSRFIQQKLETATLEEKTMIFPEIKSHTHALTIDVFGNYVIQKFFEHGTKDQRKDLARKLVGHVLPFSLQMYGCRVIQKALEVVDVEQQTMLVAELDGSVIKCVCDQNGNHVIQKCIQCVPQDRNQFIIKSFFGHIVALSMHPYGCRVIQRVLENCNDPKAQQIIMDEIVQSACTLAQDQYGNYVVQHVIQHGKAPEQSAIIRKLAGQIVKMSKQKFASNVVEKCLIFGGREDRQLIVKEMLGTTDENEPLQAMTKDPFGNYVVQKVLETCDSQSSELIVSRLKLHLSNLKRYTYGKHIVSRVEKLIAAGEGRRGLLSSY